MRKLAILFPLCVACTSTTMSSQEQAIGCDGPDSYIDENGEEVICVYTDEPSDPPEDPCIHFPEMCAGDVGDDPWMPPDPGDTGGDPADPGEGLCSVYNGPVADTGRAEGRSTVVGSEGESAYQNALDRASAAGTSSAKYQANSKAKAKCGGLLYPAGVGVCRGRGNAALLSAQGTGCVQSGAEYPPDSNTVVVVECGATASVGCEFEWSLY